jgi:hypothetical protein
MSQSPLGGGLGGAVVVAVAVLVVFGDGGGAVVVVAVEGAAEDAAGSAVKDAAGGVAAEEGVATGGAAGTAAGVDGGVTTAWGGAERSLARTTRAAVATPANRRATPPRAMRAMFTLRGVWVTMVAFPREAVLIGSPWGYSGAVTTELLTTERLVPSGTATPETWESPGFW